jgi:regulator of RNase E activity RraB
MMTAILLPIFLFGCSEFGTVDQGRAIEFDKEKGLVTIIRDVKHDAKNPDYSSLPPVTYQKPVDPQEMGADPKAGYRMKLDTKNKQIVIFDKAAQKFKTIDYVPIDEQENIDRSHLLVYDKVSEKAKKFPVVDKDKKQITIYSPRQKILVTIGVPPEYFALPDYTWDSGDEVRIYFKEPGKALRLMNISKTDIFKK